MEVGYRRRPIKGEDGKDVLDPSPPTKEEIGAEFIGGGDERIVRVTFHEPGAGGKPLDGAAWAVDFPEKVYMTLPLVMLGWPTKPFEEA